MSEQQTWNSDLYRDKHTFVWEMASSLVELLAPQSGERILDLGCGTAQLTARIAESGAEVIGLDKSEEMLEVARRHHPQIRFDPGDAHDFSYEQPFDAVFSNAALHWIREPDKVVACLARTLKVGGRLVVEFGGKGNVRRIAEALQSASEMVTGQAIAHPWYFPGIAEFSGLLEHHGLETTQAVLFDRHTDLEGLDGFRNWVKMFGGHWLEQLSPEQTQTFLQEAEARARPHLCHDDQWYADYRRLRVVAYRFRM